MIIFRRLPAVFLIAEFADCLYFMHVSIDHFCHGKTALTQGNAHIRSIICRIFKRGDFIVTVTDDKGNAPLGLPALYVWSADTA